jgi:hypothetical protein
VHAAVLRGSRKDVVVKVLKPNVTDTLKAVPSTHSRTFRHNCQCIHGQNKEALYHA